MLTNKTCKVSIKEELASDSWQHLSGIYEKKSDPKQNFGADPVETGAGWAKLPPKLTKRTVGEIRLETISRKFRETNSI